MIDGKGVKALSVLSKLEDISKDGVISGKRYDQKKQELLSKLGRPLKRIEIDPILGKLYRKLFHKVSTGVYSLEQLRHEAFNLGLKSKVKGNMLSKSVVQALLCNPFYAGEFNYGGERWVGTHEGLISLSLFNTVQNVLRSRTRPKFKKQLGC